MRVLTLEIEGMTCAMCSGTVERCLTAMEGTFDVSVNLSNNVARLEYDTDLVTKEELAEAVEDLGFGAMVLIDEPSEQDFSRLSRFAKGGGGESRASSIMSGQGGGERGGGSLAGGLEGGEDEQKNQRPRTFLLIVKHIDVDAFDSTEVLVEELMSLPDVLEVDVSKLKKLTRRSMVDVVRQSFAATPTAAQQQVSRMSAHSLGASSTSTTRAFPATSITNRSNEDSKLTGISQLSSYASELEEVPPSLFVAGGADHPELGRGPSSLPSDMKKEEAGTSDQSKKQQQLRQQPSLQQVPALDGENTSCLSSFCEFVTQVMNAGQKEKKEISLRVMVQEPSTIGPRALVAVCKANGITVKMGSTGAFYLMQRTQETSEREKFSIIKRLFFALLFTIPIFIISMITDNEPSLEVQQQLLTPVVRGVTASDIILICLSTPVQFWSGWKFHKKAWQTFRLLFLGTVELGMDFLVSTGTFAAYFYSLIGILQSIITGVGATSQVLYFETSAVLITVVLIGKAMELYARRATASAVNSLANARSTTARLVQGVGMDSGEQGEGSDEIIESSLLQAGDVIRVVSGEGVPADGFIVENGGVVGLDESMLTGESRTISKGPSKPLFSGTVVVEGSALMTVTKCGDASVLGQIVATVSNTQASKPSIQAFADRVARNFVPFVFFASFFTFILWVGAGSHGNVPADWYAKEGSLPLFAFFFSLAVWVSACPCAFGLATPTAVLVSTGIAAKYGVLIRRGAALQTSSEVTSLCFDKTGTLTLGEMSVTDVVFFPQETAAPTTADGNSGGNLEDKEVLKYLLAAEKRSSHPLAKAMVAYCLSKLDVVEAKTEMTCDVSVVPGQGVQLLLPPAPGKQVGELVMLVGSNALLTSHQINTERASKVVTDLRSQGRVVVYVSMHGSMRAVVAFADAVRQEAKQVIATLREMNVRTYMITGDDGVTAASVGASLGFSKKHIFASASPEDKKQFIEKLKARGEKVGFVGEGTNDSLALSVADVGFVLSQGTDIAIDAGDVILNAKSNILCSLIIAMDVSKHTMRRIFINYFWALCYNSILIPIAAGAMYPSYHFALAPMLAGGAMAASSVSIVLSSLCLLFYKPPVAYREVFSSSTTSSNEKQAENASSSSSSSSSLSTLSITMKTFDIGSGNVDDVVTSSSVVAVPLKKQDTCNCTTTSAPLLVDKNSSSSSTNTLWFWGATSTIQSEDDNNFSVSSILLDAPPPPPPPPTMQKRPSFASPNSHSLRLRISEARMRRSILANEAPNKGTTGGEESSAHKKKSCCSDEEAKGAGCGCGKDNCRCDTSCGCDTNPLHCDGEDKEEEVVHTGSGALSKM